MALPPFLPHRALYTAFDVYPSTKGAATHIQHAAKTVFDTAGGGLLYVLGHEHLPRYQREEHIEIVRFSGLVSNYLHRALRYGDELSQLLRSGVRKHLRIAQFRDPWGGIPIIRESQGRYKTIYEVNGLPSIELPMAYPHLSASTLRKISALEDECLAYVDQIVAPSSVIRDHLTRRGVPASHITIVPNGCELNEGHPRPVDAPHQYLLYFGAIQAWQGVDVLLRAMARLRDLPDLHLVICCSVKPKRARPYQKLVRRLGLSERITWLFQLSKSELAPWVSNAYLTVAPLVECPRNLDQGCCPLKILESMGAGVPVIASNLPVVTALVSHREDGFLVTPDRPAELARGLRVLLDYPEVVRQLGRSAQDKVRDHFLWRHSNAKLQQVLKNLGVEPE